MVYFFGVPARGAEFKAGGYLKDLWQTSHGQLDDRSFVLNTSRARLTLDGRADVFRAHADYDQQLDAGSYFRTLDYKLLGLGPSTPWLPMQQTISTGTTNAYSHGAYRAWIGVEDESGALRAGRQRIAWGAGKIWNPTDVLNPFQPTTVERDERRGVDAVYGRAGVGSLGQAELVWAPNDRWADHQVLARGRGNVGGWDASLMGGKIAGSTASYMVGGDFAGTVRDGTLHGEWGYFDPRTRTPYWKAGLGWDCTIPDDSRWKGLRDAAFVFEYYHAGNGQKNSARYNFGPVLSGNEVSVAQNYFGATYSEDLHPLVKLEMFVLMNADDRSTFFSPSLTWNALENLYLSALLQRFGGVGRTEYGRAPNKTALTAQYYF